MDKSLSSLDWSLIQAFVAVADTGSLSAAARALGLSQPTLGRQVNVLEQTIGAPLFRRQPRGMALTALGAHLLDPARAMFEAAGRLTLVAAGESQSMAGSVRITASVVISHHVLPPILAALRRAEPQIELDLVASDSTENLLFREADIAIRMYRPEQLDVVTRHLGDIPLGMYGARTYLDRKGRPATQDDLLRHDFVGHDTNDQIIREMRALGWQVDRGWFPVRCDHQTTYWELVRAGCGLGFSQIGIGRADPLVEQVAHDLPMPTLPVWLTAHEKMRQSPRIRRVWDHLAGSLMAAVS